jgi:DNA-binding NtrC family response regulator
MSRILIVDDEKSILSLLRAAFSQAGYEVRTAASGREAMEICGRERFDAVLSDVVMPEVDGHEFVHWLAGRHPATRAVLMSGYDHGCSDCPGALPHRILAKPFRPSEAVSVIDDALGSIH